MGSFRGLARQAYRRMSRRWKQKRFEAFVQCVSPPSGATVIDLGGATGRFFHENRAIVEDLGLKIVIADIDEQSLKVAEKNGLETLLLSESGFGEFQDGEFDVVFCNSVIEHVTLSKKDVWEYVDQDFAEKAYAMQSEFAKCIERIAKSYFVQTPHVRFPIESHTWFPACYIVTANRKKHVQRLKKINKYWIKTSSPDFNLLDEERFRALFPGATKVYTNTVLGFPKELIAYRSYPSGS